MKAFHHAYWLQYLSGVEFDDHQRWEEVSHQAEQLAVVVGAAVGHEASGPVLTRTKTPALNEFGIELSALPDHIATALEECIQKAGTIHFDSALSNLRGVSL